MVSLFNDCFLASENTELVAGGEEPIYLPCQDSAGHNQIIFTRDYFASALHEVAHWCVAGPERRKQVDFGYWYAPDGRTADQQRQFERVEVKPQALEWIFSRAAGFRFRVSADNLEAGLGPSACFTQAIAGQAQAYIAQGIPKRAAIFAQSLADTFGGDYLSAADYTPEALA